MSYVALWRAVLYAGLLDAVAGRDADWLRSVDFEVVCELAEVHPDAARRAVQLETVAAPLHGKRGQAGTHLLRA